MRFCKRCLYTDVHPLHLILDEEGICSGCRVHEEKNILDWSQRLEKLKSIVSGYKNQSGTNYDCIVPVSGARDSYFIVHTVKHVLGLNPLLVTYNKHYNTAVGYRNLSNLKIKLDCDVMSLTVNPEKIRKITRATLRRFGSLYWHCIAGQTVYPVQMAVKLKIPLIIWGAHQGVDQVGMYSHLDEVEMTRKYRKEHDLMGYEAEDLINEEFDNVTEDTVRPFLYPDDLEIENVGVRGIYLNNYIRWDSRMQHEDMIAKYGYETAPQTRTFDTYNDVDCWNYSDVHDFIKIVKHGYGKVVDHATREIRLQHLTKAEGLEMINQYMEQAPQNLNLFLKWLGITENAFYYIIDQFRNPLFWERNDNWDWIYKNPYQQNKEQFLGPEALTVTNAYKPFVLTKTGISTDVQNDYVLIGKGLV
jgi:N-acetyl sugar amidotransferase